MTRNTFHSPGTLFEFHCKTGASGKILRKEESGPLGRSVFDYAYDEAGRLTGVRRNNVTIETYVYDPEGRRVEDHRTWSDGKRQFIYGYDGTLIRVNDAYLEWTSKGQLKAIYSGGLRMEYDYGGDTRLDEARLPSGIVARYEYGKGLMPLAVLENLEPVYRYDWSGETRLRRCIDIRNSVTYEFSYGSGGTPERVRLQASPDTLFGLTGVRESALTLRIWTDQIGSVRVLSAPDGRPLKCLEYDAFGNVTHETRSEWRFPLGFACGLQDDYTGFVRFGYRDYDPQVGRFTAKDPAGYTGGDNDPWEYCVDDPIGSLDVTGLSPMTLEDRHPGPKGRLMTLEDRLTGQKGNLITLEDRQPGVKKHLVPVEFNLGTGQSSSTAAWGMPGESGISLDSTVLLGTGRPSSAPGLLDQMQRPAAAAALLGQAPRPAATVGAEIRAPRDIADIIRANAGKTATPEPTFGEGKNKELSKYLRDRQKQAPWLLTDEGFLGPLADAYQHKEVDYAGFIRKGRQINGPGPELDALAQEVEQLTPSQRTFIAAQMGSQDVMNKHKDYPLALLLGGVSKNRIDEALDPKVDFQSY